MLWESDVTKTARIIQFLGLVAAPASGGTLLHPMFQDHAVLQRGAPIPVYGDAAPGSDVTVTLGAGQAHAKADPQGHWHVALPAMPAGGPYLLRAATASGDSEEAKDVLVGDVFLCGGQSNMQFEVRQANNAQADIAAAQDGEIRSLSIRTKDSVSPLASFADPVRWIPASPTTVGGFSAACYFFARELKQTTHAPIGMVVAAWGGSRGRAWVSEPGLRAAGLQAESLRLLDLHRSQPMAGDRAWSDVWERWWRAQGINGGAPWQVAFDDSSWRTAPEKLGPWALWNGSSPDGFTGQMWLRTRVTLTAEQAAQKAVLDLGNANEEDQSWANGTGVGGTSWARQARHDIPAGVLHAGENVIVTNIFCSWRNCGLNGPASGRAIRLADGSAVPLDRAWRYAEMPSAMIAPQLPWGPAHGAAVIYNGMIAPIGHYGFRSVVWYQGESDIHFAPEYAATLKAMMVDWRRDFRPDLPFLIVQLPNFGAPSAQPQESELADVREGQRRVATADRHADYVVTIDIGDPNNIHPTNKQEVGRRLALAARRLLLGEQVPTGARPGAATRSGGTITVKFVSVTGALTSSSADAGAFELCGPGKGTCKRVAAKISGRDMVTIDATAIRPVRLRYCWGDSPVCTLSDGSGLPAGPFEIPVR